VSGSGKSTIAGIAARAGLAVPGRQRAALAGQCREDARRPSAHRRRPAAFGRRPSRWIDDRLAAHEPGIITCSDLKRAYRDITIGNWQGVRLIYLKGDEQVIHDRIILGQHQYMPPSLLRSQLETLEELTPDEHPIVVAVHGSTQEIVTELLRRLSRG
jgi:gluconokinase